VGAGLCPQYPVASENNTKHPVSMTEAGVCSDITPINSTNFIGVILINYITGISSAKVKLLRVHHQVASVIGSVSVV